jgi:hypothetical protein
MTLIRNRTAMAAGAALLAVLAGPALAQDIGGNYTVEGKNPDGSTYSGTATIEGTTGGNCAINWSIGNGQASQAFCMRQNNVLSGAYILGDAIGIVVYQLGNGGELEGTWSIAGKEGVGVERLTPAN